MSDNTAPGEYGYNSAGERTWTGWNPTKPKIALSERDAVIEAAQRVAWRDGSNAGFEYGYLKGSTDPDFIDDSDAPVNPYPEGTR